MRDDKILHKMATGRCLLLALKNALLTVVFSTNNPGISKHCSSVAKYGLISWQCLLLNGAESVFTGLRINSRDVTEVKTLVF